MHETMQLLDGLVLHRNENEHQDPQRQLRVVSTLDLGLYPSRRILPSLRIRKALHIIWAAGGPSAGRTLACSLAITAHRPIG